MADDKTALCGAWESTEAFGNTALDWSQALKDQRVRLAVAFTPQGQYAFELFTQDTSAAEAKRTDVTATFRHVVASNGKYELQGDKGLLLEGMWGLWPRLVYCETGAMLCDNDVAM